MTDTAALSPDSPVLLATADGVATVTLNRPHAMNGLDVATKELLRDVLAAVAEDDAVRCVVLTGTGRAFCAGQDLKEHAATLQGDRDAAAGSPPLGSTVEDHYNPIVTSLLTMPKPVVAAVNGVAAGAGASIALACDLRLVAEGAGLNFAFAGIALSCDTGSSVTLPRIVGHAKALELMYFPRTVPSAECLDLGLATRVVPDTDLAAEAGALARRLAAGPTLALASIRASMAYSARHPLAESLAHEAEMMSRTGASEDHRRAVASFLAKEAPVFTGR